MQKTTCRTSHSAADLRVSSPEPPSRRQIAIIVVEQGVHCHMTDMRSSIFVTGMEQLLLGCSPPCSLEARSSPSLVVELVASRSIDCLVIS